MKKIFYFTMLVLLSMALIGSVSAEEGVKSDNKSAVKEGIVAQELPAATEQGVESAADIAANTIEQPALCKAQRDKCCESSPMRLLSNACRNFREKCSCEEN
ncbi:MAG TPA: hypothetical protein ENI07_10380 [Desulfobacterales bacterium]|nr:hypothetical protein [Desulfobacterales bacterium]